MDAEGARLLTEQERVEYSAWEEMFNTTGWALFMQDLQEEIDDLPRRLLQDAQSWDEVLALRALNTKLLEIMAYPALAEMRYENAVQAAADNAEDRREASRPDV